MRTRGRESSASSKLTSMDVKGALGGMYLSVYVVFADICSKGRGCADDRCGGSSRFRESKIGNRKNRRGSGQAQAPIPSGSITSTARERGVASLALGRGPRRLRLTSSRSHTNSYYYGMGHNIFVLNVSCGCALSGPNELQQSASQSSSLLLTMLTASFQQRLLELHPS